MSALNKIKARHAIVGRLYTDSPYATVPSVCVFVNAAGRATLCLTASPHWMVTHGGTSGSELDLYEHPDDPAAVARVIAHLYLCARNPRWAEQVVRAHEQHRADVEREMGLTRDHG